MTNKNLVLPGAEIQITEEFPHSIARLVFRRPKMNFRLYFGR